MKKPFVLLLSFFSVSFTLQAQTAKWFCTLSSGFDISGPGPLIKRYMKNNGFDAATPGFLIFGPTTYPYITVGFPLIGMIGKQVSKLGSVYVIFGESDRGEVHGYNSIFVNNIRYSVLQFTGGYQFSFSTTKFKLGAGPSVFVLKYAKNDPSEGNYDDFKDKHSVISPGVSITGRMPFGKEKELFGIELFLELNVSSKARLEKLPVYNSGPVLTYDVNMIHGVVGLSFALRKQ